MATIFEMAERFARLDLMREAQIAIGKTGKAMIKAQIEQRLEAGTDGKGRKFRRYAPSYRQFKLDLGHNDVTDLTLTGATNEAMFVDVDGEEFTIDSTGVLVPELEAKYGKDMFGLDIEGQQGQDYIDDSLWPQLQEQIEKITGIEFH